MRYIEKKNCSRETFSELLSTKNESLQKSRKWKTKKTNVFSMSQQALTYLISPEESPGNQGVVEQVYRGGYSLTSKEKKKVLNIINTPPRSSTLSRCTRHPPTHTALERERERGQSRTVFPNIYTHDIVADGSANGW